jgi:hypothetical protein
MSARRTLALEADVLLGALVARDEGLLATYLDLRDGSLVRLYDPMVTGRDNEALLSRIDAEPDRFAEVPRYTRHYRLMTEFVDTVDDDHLARLLDTALGGREAFRRFEAVLGAWPVERERWRLFREEALEAWAVAWLRSVGVEPDWGRGLPPEAPADVPLLLEVALRGGVIEAADEAEAASLLVRLARQLCELRCEPFRARSVRERGVFRRGGIEIRREGRTIRVATLS